MPKPVVICVDDEPTVLESLKIDLKRILGDSCLIETAEDGSEALELFEELQQSDEYEVALVLADYIMHRLSALA
jgi:two-component system, sensor histidine kinase and response regulator